MRSATRTKNTAPKPKPNPNRERRGASTAKRSVAHRIESYFSHHRSSFRTTVKRLWQDKIQTLMTSLVVAIALALPALLLVALTNFQQLGDSWDAEPRLSVYLNSRAKQTAVDALIDQLEQDLRSEHVRFISADQALEEFERQSGFGRVLQGLEDNPLPATIEITVASSHRGVEQQQALAQEWQALAIVDQVAVDLQWVQRFLALTELAQKLVLVLALLLAMGALLAIGNTIRLIIENRKDEITVIKLVGGTNGFVRRPLLYTGGVYGLVGAAMAVFVVQFVLVLVTPGIEALAESYNSSIALQGLGFTHSVKVLGAGALIGWLGALLAVSRHLSAIEPS